MTAIRKRRTARSNEPAEAAVPADGQAAERNADTSDTAANYLTPLERERLGMDSWEPSLLRQLLEAENRLPRKR